MGGGRTQDNTAARWHHRGSVVATEIRPECFLLAGFRSALAFQTEGGVYLLVDLPQVDDLLHCPQRDQPEHGHVPALAYTVRSENIKNRAAKLTRSPRMDGWNDPADNPWPEEPGSSVASANGPCILPSTAQTTSSRQQYYIRLMIGRWNNQRRRISKTESQMPSRPRRSTT